MTRTPARLGSTGTANRHQRLTGIHGTGGQPVPADRANRPEASAAHRECTAGTSRAGPRPFLSTGWINLRESAGRPQRIARYRPSDTPDLPEGQSDNIQK